MCIGRLEGILSAKDEHFGDKIYKATNIANSVSDKSNLDVDYVIEFDNIRFAYKEGENVLNDVSFKIKNGENIAIVGSSGGGKTTIFRLLCGLYHASDGTYKLYGMDINEWNIESARENMALVSQDTFLFPGTIEENIRYGNINATHDEVVNACKDARIHDFIEGLTDGYETVISEGGSQLSGGQRQRIAIARGLTTEPDLLIADEPVASLDVSIQAQIINLFKHLQEDHGFSIVFIAHDLSMVEFLCDRVAVMYHGRIVELATKALYETPLHPYTKDLLSAIPVPDPILERKKVRPDYSKTVYDTEGQLKEVKRGHFVLTKEGGEAVENK